MEIHKTTEYSKFNLYECNRPTQGDYVLNSIKSNNLLHLHPIIVDKNMSVIDGQHRLQAAKELEVPIYYIQCPEVTSDDIPILQIQKVWAPENYMNFYKNYNEDYKFLYQIYVKHNFPINFLVKIMGKGRDVVQLFRKGKFKLAKDRVLCWERELIRFKELIELCKTITKTLKIGITMKFYVGLWNFFVQDNFDFDKLARALDFHREEVINASKFSSTNLIHSHLREFVYNKRIRRASLFI